MASKASKPPSKPVLAQVDAPKERRHGSIVKRWSGLVPMIDVKYFLSFSHLILGVFVHHLEHDIGEFGIELLTTALDEF